MYILLLLAGIVLGLNLVLRGTQRRRPRLIAYGLLTVVLTGGFFSLLDFWAEMLWFDATGYGSRFWTMVITVVGSAGVGIVIGVTCVYAMTRPIPKHRRLARLWPESAAALAGALIGLQSWDEVLLFLNRVSTGLSDPILQLDTGFYLFVLPLLDRVYLLLLWCAGLGLAAALVSTFYVYREGEVARREPSGVGRAQLSPLLKVSGFVAVVLAAGHALAALHLMYSEWGVVAGPGWTDIHIRLPAYGLIAVLTLFLGGPLLIPGVRQRLLSMSRPEWRIPYPDLLAPGALWLTIGVIWVLGLWAVPSLVQWIVVEPNEITFEKPYIAHNIDYTKRGFRLHEAEDRQFPATEQFTRETVDRNRDLMSEVRLWDLRALDAVYRQFQEIRLYYEFNNVDIDRYRIGGRYRQVMASAREMNKRNLAEQSQTFVNERFKYTHGYGLTLAPVSDFTPDGLPNLLVKDIPPQSSDPALEVDRPEIYYGELTRDSVVVNTTEKEFDHPRGEKNVYTRYSGEGGVLLRDLWRKFVFGWKFDGTRYFFSTYPTPESRVMFYREVRERAAHLAPFLEFDEDPYIVIHDGRLHWILDAYTTSNYYPYSEPFSSRELIEQNDRQHSLAGRVAQYLDGVNYVRNSVKVVIDAYEGSVQFYVFDPGDPIIQAWQNAFPDLFKPREEMAPGLQRHVRYPEGFLLSQGLVYTKYHMEDPEVFYNQEDLWVRATEKYYAHVQPVEPYYVMWKPPGSEQAEFVLMLPFTPKNRQVLIGWIAGLCDGENYGRFLAYKFPKEKRVLGPQQVETKIDQDRFLSGQLTLWDQRGSNVIRGNMLAIPIEDTLMYVEPIYLQAETAAFPELRLVVVMHGDTMSYAETFDEALAGLLERKAGQAGPAPDMEAERTQRDLALEANEAFEAYLSLQAEQRFEEAGRELERLRDLLQRLTNADRR